MTSQETSAVCCNRSARRHRLCAVSGALLALVFTCGSVGGLRGDDGVEESVIKPPPPLDTELSRIKNVSIIRIEETDPNDDIWEDRRNIWRFQHHDHRSGRLRIKAESLLEILCGEARLSPLRVFGGDELPLGRYNVVVKGLPQSDSRAYAVEQLSRAYEESFDVTIVHEIREIPVLTLRPAVGNVETLKEMLAPRNNSDGSQSISTSSGGDGVTDVEYQGSLASFAEYLEEELGEVVIDHSRVKGQVTLNFDHESVPNVDDAEYDYYTSATLTELRRRRLEDIDKGLRKYGLTLRRTRQRVKGLFITPGRPEAVTTAAAPTETAVESTDGKSN